MGIFRRKLLIKYLIIKRLSIQIPVRSVLMEALSGEINSVPGFTGTTRLRLYNERRLHIESSHLEKRNVQVSFLEFQERALRTA